MASSIRKSSRDRHWQSSKRNGRARTQYGSRVAGRPVLSTDRVSRSYHDFSLNGLNVPTNADSSCRCAFWVAAASQDFRNECESGRSLTNLLCEALRCFQVASTQILAVKRTYRSVIINRDRVCAMRSSCSLTRSNFINRADCFFRNGTLCNLLGAQIIAAYSRCECD